MTKKLIKWIGLVLAIVVLISLFFYVGDKKKKKKYSPDAALKLAMWEINERKDYPKAIDLLEDVLPASTRYADVHAVLGKAFLLNNNFDSAKKELLTGLKLDKKNEAALLNLVTISLIQHDTGAAIGYIERYNKYYPNDRQQLARKYALQLEVHNYKAARSLHDSLQRLGAADTLSRIAENYWSQRTGPQEKASGPAAALRRERKPAARTHGNPETEIARADESSSKGEPLIAIKTKITTTINPAITKDALLMEINNNLSAKRYNDALLTVNRALAAYPQDQDFINKKTSILFETRNYSLATAFLETLPGYKSNPKYIQAHTDIASQQAAELMRQGEFAMAIAVIERGLADDPDNIGLSEQAMNAYAGAGKTTAAIEMAEKLTRINPSNETYLFKKAGLLETLKRYEEAAVISHGLMLRYPQTTKYRQAFSDEITNAEKQALNDGLWQKTIDLFNQRAGIKDPGKLAFQYAMAAYTEEKNQLQVLYLADSALAFYPGDSLFLVKKAVALQLLNMHPESMALGKELVKRYPGDAALQRLYLEQLFSAGKYYEREKRTDTALSIFLAAHDRSPADTFALENLAAIYFTKRQYDSSIFYAELGLAQDSKNAFLLMKEAYAYDQLKDYPKALQFANRALALEGGPVKPEYLNYLRSKTFLNQVGIMHLQSVFSSPGQFTSITGVRYMKRLPRGSIGGHVNFGQRPAGNGVQAGLDVYLTHNTRYYSNIFLNASTGTAFPYWQAGYSIYRNLPKDWEIELGGRYTGFDTAHVFTAVGAIAKYFDRTWLNLRGFYSREGGNGYASTVLTIRQYLNEKRDYLSFIAGTGKTPDDPGLVTNFVNFRGYRTITTGIGFQKVFKYRTFLQGSVNYTNLSIPSKRSLNQYDFYLSVFRNF